MVGSWQIQSIIPVLFAKIRTIITCAQMNDDCASLSEFFWPIDRVDIGKERRNYFGCNTVRRGVSDEGRVDSEIKKCLSRARILNRAHSRFPFFGI